MLIKIKGFSQKFALGLRWLVATRDEVDYLKEREKLSYGFINNLREKNANNQYRNVVLTDSDYDKSISVAGILSESYQDLIFIHHTQNDNYWLCIIKNHEVWNGLNLGEKTAGDYICGKEQALQILTLAQEAFEEDGITPANITYTSSQTEAEFPELPSLRLTEMLENAKRHYPKYRIIWLQSHRKKIKRLIGISLLLVLSISGIVYVYSSQNSNAEKRAAILQAELEKQRQIQEKENYFRTLKEKIFQTQTTRSITRFLDLVAKLSLQSSGWEMTGINYISVAPSRIDVTLKRRQYGDILSFRSAYVANTVKEDIAADNNSGTKTLDFQKNAAPIAQPTASAADLNAISNILSSDTTNQHDLLIAIGQKLNLKIQTSAITPDRYNVSKSNYTIDGDSMWNLRKLTFLFADFTSMTVNTITMTINDRKITWKITGEIYD